MSFYLRVLHEARAIRRSAISAELGLGIGQCVTIAASRVRHPQVKHCWEDRLMLAMREAA